MSAVDLAGEITVNTFGFNVPCRQFVIGAQVTRDRRMPMVDEFVLRVLKLCDRVPVTRLAAYFGFTTEEMRTVLSDLAARTLVIVEKDDVMLHGSAHEMFRTATEAIPTIMEVEEWTEWLWFDLISQSMISPQALRRGSYLLELKSDSTTSVSQDFASQAFRSNFTDYLRRVRRIRNTGQLSLYAITAVQPGRFGYVPIAAHEDLLLEPRPKLRPSIATGGDERPQRLRLLTDAMVNTLQMLVSPDPSTAAQSEFERWFDTSLAFPGRDGEFDLRQWLAYAEQQFKGDASPFVGATYLDRNRSSFCALLQGCSPDAIRSDAELTWYRPGGTAWGATDDLRLTIGDVRAVLKSVKADVAVKTTLVIPSALRNDRPRRFERIIDQGFVAPARYISPALEVVLIRGIAAMVAVSVRLSESVIVPIGVMTTRVEDLNRIEQRLMPPGEPLPFQQVWSTSRGAEPRPGNGRTPT